jgi:hypothetical protein
MAKQQAQTIRLRIVYDGTPPNVWDGGASAFGVQDNANGLLLGETGANGHIAFDVTVGLKPERTAAPVFLGDFVHGPPKERFLYLSWRNTNGAYAQRLKLPLGGISWRDIDAAQGKPLVGVVAPSNKPRKPGGTNVGGLRAVAWSLGKER